MKFSLLLKDMVKELSRLEEVEGIMLAGSHAINTNDEDSDYDIYVYCSKDISLEKRKNITDKYCSYMEFNNEFWETEDDGVLMDNIQVELIYRRLEWIDTILEKKLINYQADVGYTTCFCSNFINSLILYDKSGILKKLQQKYNIIYPQQLKINIIKKNYPLLRSKMPAYYYQIEKAIKRNDLVSINHRVAALLASYFDIIFAINEMLHPGEKKILKIIKEKAKKVPKNMESNITSILKAAAFCDKKILREIDELMINLDSLLKEEKAIF